MSFCLLKTDSKNLVFSILDFSRILMLRVPFLFHEWLHSVWVWNLKSQSLQAAPKSMEYDFSKLSVFLGQILVSVTLQNFAGDQRQGSDPTF